LVACLAVTSSGCGGGDNSKKDAVAECGSLSTFKDDTVGCIDVGAAALGEVFAVAIDNSQPPVRLGAFAPTQPAPSSVVAAAPAACAQVLAEPVNQLPAAGYSHTYQLPAFKVSASVDLSSVSAQLNADVNTNTFDLNIGQIVALGLADPVRALNCSSEVIDATNQYWSALTPKERTNVLFFVVSEIVETTSASVTTMSGTSLGAKADVFHIANVDISVTYECSELIDLDGGLTPVFFKGYTQGLTFDGTSFSATPQTVTCNAVLGSP
jgi:hypothetical protein